MEKMSRQAMDKVIDDHFMYEATADLEGVLRTYTDDPEHQVRRRPIARERVWFDFDDMSRQLR